MPLCENKGYGILTILLLATSQPRNLATSEKCKENLRMVHSQGMLIGLL